jgi:spore maturation protein CgeB
VTNIKIASVLDKFSFSCFQYESNTIPLTKKNWHETLTLEKPDLLLVESTWDQVNRKLISSYLKSIIKKCHDQQIPTVFWNKEDPYHFDKFIHEAKFFDYIFTTDLNCVPRYQKKLGHNRIFILPFAAQPKLYNPIGKDQEKLGTIAFAGTWYPFRTERGRDMHDLLGPALKYGLHIYDRNYNTRPGLYPDLYHPCIKGWVPYEQLGSIYKKYYICLNINTVKNSHTMFARRVFELLACGVAVVSNYSPGIMEMFPGIVSICNTKEETEKYLAELIADKNLRDKRALLGQRKVFAAHTYYHRMQTILNAIGFTPVRSDPEGVSIITWVDSCSQLENIRENFQRQKYDKKELILILRIPDNNKLEVFYERTVNCSNISVFEFDGVISNDDCLIFGLKHAHYNCIAWFDSNSYYGADFLTDLMNAFKYTDAEIVGKATYYSYSAESCSLEINCPEQEYRYVNRILSTAAIFKRELLQRKDWVELLLADDGLLSDPAEEIKLFAGDRFNFIHEDYPAELSQRLIDEVCL